MVRNILEPMLGRVGTAIGFALASWGVSETDANLISWGVIAAIGVGVDLVTRRFFGAPK